MLKRVNTELPKGGPKFVATIYSMYPVPAICWASILAQMSLKDLNKLDSLLTKRAKRQYVPTISDSAISLFGPIKSYRGGIRSFVNTDISSNARKLKTTLSNTAENGIALRSILNFSKHLPGDY